MPRRKFLSMSTALALQGAIERQQCLVCAVQQRGFERALFWLVNETYSDGPTINKLVDSQGLCVNHLRLLLTPENHSQLNFVCEFLTSYNVGLASAALRQAGADRRMSVVRIVRGRRSIGRAFVPRSDCPFCFNLRGWERWTLEDLADFSGDPEVEAVSKYTCLPHALMLIPLTTRDTALSLAEAVRQRLVTFGAGDGSEPTPAAEFFLARYPRATRSTFLPSMVAELLADARLPANAVWMKTRQNEASTNLADCDLLDRAECLLCQVVRSAEALPLEGEAQDFCRPHAGRRMAEALIATVQQLVDWAPRAVEERLAQRPHRWMANIVRETSCPACRRRAQGIASIVETMEKAGPDRFAGARFCLPHLPLVLDRVSPDAAITILRAERDLLASLHAELEEFFRKCDYRFHHEPIGTEATAWLRAADLLMGSYPADPGYDVTMEAQRGRTA